MSHVVKIGDNYNGIFINLDKVLSIDYDHQSGSVYNVTITYVGDSSETLEWTESQIQELEDFICE